jgi:hypothetical protein
MTTTYACSAVAGQARGHGVLGTYATPTGGHLYAATKAGGLVGYLFVEYCTDGDRMRQARREFTSTGSTAASQSCDTPGIVDRRMHPARGRARDPRRSSAPVSR